MDGFFYLSQTFNDCCRIFSTLLREMIELVGSWVHRERSAKRASLFLAKCGLPILFACHQVWSVVDNNSQPWWQTYIGGIRQIKLAGWIEEDSTTNINPSSCLWIPNPVRQAGSAADRVLIYCGTSWERAATSKQRCIWIVPSWPLKVRIPFPLVRIKNLKFTPWVRIVPLWPLRI